MALNKEDIRQLTDDELIEKIGSEKLRYRKMKFNHAVSPLDNPAMIKIVRRDIARLKTEVVRREEEKLVNQNDKTEA